MPLFRDCRGVVIAHTNVKNVRVVRRIWGFIAVEPARDNKKRLKKQADAGDVTEMSRVPRGGPGRFTTASGQSMLPRELQPYFCKRANDVFGFSRLREP